MNKQFPQNYIIKNPLFGTLIFLAFCLGFVLIYRPLDLHEAGGLNFEFTMAIYLFSLSVPLFILIKILKIIPWFSNPEEWNVAKELTSIGILLLGMGISIYFMGFLMESPGPRWNFSTLIDSCEHAFIIGIVPFLFFTGTNYRHLFAREVVRNFDPDPAKSSRVETETLIHIESRLKKEELNFSPKQFVYAVSDGNYVVFYLNIEGKIQKKIIRNSINSIEEQLPAPYYMRTHRGFIVNVKQVVSQKGNTLGYRLKLEGVDDIIPVSRQKAREFDQVLKQYR